MNKRKRDLLLPLLIIVASLVIFAGIFLGVTYPRPIAPDGAPDEIVELGYESHLTGLFVELWMGGEAQEAIAVTAALVVTPTGTYQPLTSAGNVTCTLGTMGAWGRYTGVRNVTYTTGSLLWLVNTSSTFITVTEASFAGGTTSRLTGTTVALGVNDTLTLYFDGNDWVELSESNN